jgi:hypothetical protein
MPSTKTAQSGRQTLKNYDNSREETKISST